MRKVTLSSNRGRYRSTLDLNRRQSEKIQRHDRLSRWRDWYSKAVQDICQVGWNCQLRPGRGLYLFRQIRLFGYRCLLGIQVWPSQKLQPSPTLPYTLRLLPLYSLRPPDRDFRALPPITSQEKCRLRWICQNCLITKQWIRVCQYAIEKSILRTIHVKDTSQ